MHIPNSVTLVSILFFLALSHTKAQNPSTKQSLRDSNFQQLLKKAGGGGSSPGWSSAGTGSAPAGGSTTNSSNSISSGGGYTSTAGGSTISNSTGGGSSSNPATLPVTSPSSTSGSVTGSSIPGSSPASSNSGGAPASGGDGKTPTYEQFCAAVEGYSKTSAGGSPPKPSKELYDAYVKNVASKMSFKEQAMFLANSIWETGGLKEMKETACSDGHCSYGKYYGRGFLQLTWDYNYKAASQGIYGNQSLYDNPDMAATPEGAWATALWYWTTNVAPVIQQNNAAETYKLGYTVKAINGSLECPGSQQAQNRLAIYNEILEKWGIDKTKPGKLEGC